MSESLTTLVAGTVVGVILATGWALLSPGGNVPDNAPSIDCYEDEIVAWDGDEHTVCIPINEWVPPVE